MNVKIGTGAALFPEKEYINGIFLAVHPGGSRFQGVKKAPDPGSAKLLFNVAVSASL
jgi:hypothetical protein